MPADAPDPESPAISNTETATVLKDLRSRRVKAALVDIALLTGVAIIFTLLAGEARSGSDGFYAGLTGVPSLLYLAFVLAYFFIFETAFGQTVGKRWLGIKVIDDEFGELAGVRMVGIRTLMRLVDWFPAFYLAGYIAIRFSGERFARLGDMAAKSSVTHTEDVPAGVGMSATQAAAALAGALVITLGGAAAWPHDEQDFRASADRVCEQFSGDFRGPMARLNAAQSREEALGALNGLEPVIHAANDQLSELHPPESLSGLWAHFKQNIGDQSVLVTSLRKAAQRDDLVEYQRLRVELSEVTRERPVLDRYGFLECG